MIHQKRLAAGLATLLLVVAFAATACSSGDGESTDATATAAANEPLRAAGALPAVPKPGLILNDTSGEPFDIVNDTEGKLTLFYVGYTFCPDICPTTMSDLAHALESLTAAQRKEVVVVFVTADPARDTPEALRNWLDAFDPSFIGLIPTLAQRDQLTAMLKMRPTETTEVTEKYYTVSHAAYVIAFDQTNTGRFVYPYGITIADWKHDLPLLIKGMES